ncbi:hypothetical protein ZHAS_00012366 [Anopheles sinensis]|uniref:Uncharacterized protein n=1 Tax=Anopheles sinensis TaxID=74873 RepID=A0A084W2N8_ANOSI|nr:hypothetical protein ZHAS_00012366 [Anopheles sinensis]
MTDQAAIPLQEHRTSSGRREDNPTEPNWGRVRRNSPRRSSVDTGREETDTTTVDVSSIAGLITILTVNLHQLESLLQVGPELGPKYWINFVLIIISIVCVYPLIAIRKIQSEKHPPASWLRRKRCLEWTSLVLTVLLFTINLTLQIINDISAQCMVLFNQQLPPVPHAHLLNCSA